MVRQVIPAYGYTTTVRKVVQVHDGGRTVTTQEVSANAPLRTPLLTTTPGLLPTSHLTTLHARPLIERPLIENRTIRYEERVDSNGVRTQRFYDSRYPDGNVPAGAQLTATGLTASGASLLAAAASNHAPVPLYGFRPMVNEDGVQPPLAAPRGAEDREESRPKNPDVSVGRPVSTEDGWPWLRREGEFDVYRAPDGSEVRRALDTTADDEDDY